MGEVAASDDSRQIPANPDQTSNSLKADETERVLLKRIALREAWVRLCWRPLFMLSGLALVVYVSSFPAKALGGQETVVNIQVAITLSVALGITGLGSAIWGNRHRRRADQLNARNKELSRDVKELKQRLRDNNLSDKVTR